VMTLTPPRGGTGGRGGSRSRARFLSFPSTAGPSGASSSKRLEGIGAHLTNDENKARLIDLKREHLIDEVCIQETLSPEK